MAWGQDYVAMDSTLGAALGDLNRWLEGQGLGMQAQEVLGILERVLNAAIAIAVEEAIRKIDEGRTRP